jgi:hypothetical protein
MATQPKTFTYPFIPQPSGIPAAGAVVEFQQLDEEGEPTGSWVPIQFLLDSGADTPTLPNSAMQSIGISSEETGTPEEMEGIDSKPVQAEQYTLTARFQGSTTTFPLQVTFLPDPDMLLGRLSLWQSSGGPVTSIVIDCVKQQTTFALA